MKTPATAMSVDDLGPARAVTACPVCSSSRLYYLFSVQDRRVVCCNDCGLLASDPPVDARSASTVFRPGFEWEWSEIDRTLGRAGPASVRYLLYVGSRFADFASHAPAGYELESLRADSHSSLCPEPERPGYDAVVLDEALNQVIAPRLLLNQVRCWLKPDGFLAVTTPDLEDWSLKRQRNGHGSDAPPGAYYLNATVLQSLLFTCWFRDIELRSPHRRPSDGKACTVFCRPVKPRHRLMLSVIVPVFDEAATVRILLEKLTAKTLAGLDIEIIVIESNSSDGSREAVQQFAGRQNVRLVFEEKPRGKGHAVRTALRHATGDFVLIQDADLEYDLEDYDALLKPLIAGRRAFVLGARHGGNSWKIRRFSDQPSQALLLNLAHHFFTLLINLSLGLRLDDPFTMFKVFRRDCLHGLRLECNRFDFDWELLIKLVRKGYRPLEIPVNYRSRSFKEGKKIRIIRDPLTWIIAWAKARFGPLN